MWTIDVYRLAAFDNISFMKVEYKDELISLSKAKAIEESIVVERGFGMLGNMARDVAKRKLKAKIHSVELALSIWDHLKTTPSIRAKIFPITYFERDFAEYKLVEPKDIQTATRLLERDGLIKFDGDYLVLTHKGLKSLETF